MQSAKRSSQFIYFKGVEIFKMIRDKNNNNNSSNDDDSAGQADDALPNVLAADD